MRYSPLLLLTLLGLFSVGGLLAEDGDCCDYGRCLMRDLLIVDTVNQMLCDRLPVTFNHLLQGGYLNMPSSRMADEGNFGIGYSEVPPYRNINLRYQLTPDVEITGNYRIFRGCADPILSPYGFGDLSDRGVNFKLAILHPEDSDFVLPGVAIGADDVSGTRAFATRYLVLTQVFPKYNFEVSLGYGEKRLQGVFGGALWMPWRNSGCHLLESLALVAEYDAIDYRNPEHEHHPDGRDVNSRINLGAKYRLWDYVDLSASWIRGREFAWSISASYNIGETAGFLPKVDDPLPYRAPVNLQPIGCLRTADDLAQDLSYALRHHGFELLRAILVDDCRGERILRLVLFNRSYYWESCIREQLESLIANLLPNDVDRVVVEIYEQCCSVQEYRFRGDVLRMYRNQEICDYELYLLSPLREVSCDCGAMWKELLYEKRLEWFCPSLLPKNQFLFGSSRGKFRYALGLAAGGSGYLPWEVYYRFTLGYYFCSNIPRHLQQDLLNPSQLPNVQTDIYTYLHTNVMTIDEAFIQKNWNLGWGFFGRISAGYFSQMYGGGDVELLYYPVDSCFAIGLDAAYLRKRTTTGWRFVSRIRKLEGLTPTYVKFPLYQYFVDVYYNLYAANLDFKVSAGRFLAGDHGGRFEVGRNYNSGLRLSFWYTLTNAHDVINGKTYYDTGVAFSMPLDVFFTCSSRQEWGAAIAAWLRDCGYRTWTGDKLYHMIQWDRRW